jgi:phage-related protein
LSTDQVGTVDHEVPGGEALPMVRGPDAARRNWIWFRNDRDGRSKAREEFDAFPTVPRAGLAKRIDRYLSGASRFKDVDSLGDGILELRHRHLNNHYRVLFMLWGPHCVALTAFQKKQRATPRMEMERARTRARRWKEMFGEEP